MFWGSLLLLRIFYVTILGSAFSPPDKEWDKNRGQRHARTQSGRAPVPQRSGREVPMEWVRA